MAESITISKLKIEIGASSTKAVRELDKLNDAMSKVNSTVKNAQGNHTRKLFGDVADIRNTTRELAGTTKKMAALYKITNSLSRIAFYRLIRSAIKAVTDALQEGTTNAYNFSKAFGDSTNGVQTIAQAYDRLASSGYKLTNQLGAAWSSLVRAVTPLILQFLNLVTRVADALTQLFAVFAGSGTYLKAIDYNKEWGASAAGAAKAAKEWKNQLMGFDEINRLEEPTEPTGGGGGAATPDFSKMFEQAEVNTKLQNIVETIKKHLKEIELFAYGALLGIGLILLMTGANVPLGLGLIAAGAYGLAKSIQANWDWLTEDMKNSLAAIEMIGFGAAFGIGLTLLLTGANVPLGLGLVAAGLYGFANSAAMNWDEIPEKIKRAIGAIDLVLGGGLFAIGALLAFSSANIPLGVGLMAAGLASMAAGVTLDWDYIKSSLNGTLTAIELVLGSAMLALGAVLTFATPSFSALGIGLMVAGATTLASAAVMNWDSMPKNIESTITKIALIAGGAMLALGLILTLATPAFSPLGLGMIVAGAASLGASAAVNWEYIQKKLQGTLGLILTVAGSFLLPIGLILACTGIGIPLGLGLMLAGGAALGVGAKNYNWDALPEKLRGVWSNIKNWWQSDVSKYFTAEYWAEKINPILERVFENIDRIIGDIRTVFQGIIDFVAGIFTGDWDRAWRGVTEIFGGVVNAVIDAVNSMFGWLNGLIDGIAKAISWLRGLFDNLSAAAESNALKIEADGSIYLQGFASGGYPKEGQMFFAREAGPELVGTMNGRTAVANNDQIVEGISAGVFNAVVAAFSQSGGSGDDRPVNIYLDGRQIAQTTTKYQTQFARAAG